MSTLRVNSLLNAAGTDTPAIDGLAKAWVNFNGTGTVAIRAAFNVRVLRIMQLVTIPLTLLLLWLMQTTALRVHQNTMRLLQVKMYVLGLALTNQILQQRP